jgi:hypothetical protein
VPVVLTIEGTDDANLHSAGYMLDRINLDLALDILRMNTAFVAGEPQPGRGRRSVPSPPAGGPRGSAAMWRFVAARHGPCA